MKKLLLTSVCEHEQPCTRPECVWPRSELPTCTQVAHDAVLALAEAVPHLLTRPLFQEVCRFLAEGDKRRDLRPPSSSRTPTSTWSCGLSSSASRRRTPTTSRAK